MAPLEPWEKVLVNADTFPGSVHGLNGCTDCHAGVSDPEKEVAHTGLIVRPSEDPEATCGACHPNIVQHTPDSLHVNLAGYWTVLQQRTTPAHYDELMLAYDNHCTSCHASCGDCHVSQPALVGGGLIEGHQFNATPSMTRNCTACHGSRVGNEYLGKHEGLRADVHFRQGRMTCVDCHDTRDMHGAPERCTECHNGPESEQVPPPDHRYSGIQSPTCEACHPTASTGQDDIMMHDYHGGQLSCQVCHSIAYTSCDGCHVSISETTGNPIYATDGSYLTFFIGRNPLKSFQRPYEYVPVRHVPVAPDSFAFYGDNLLDRFSNLETWKYTTPHNIQRNTPQTETCNACHGNADIFLTADKVAPGELEANEDVIIENVPPAILSGDQLR